MRKTALIMAGGKGERFWPKSRQSLPKQFLSLTNDGLTMIQLTVKRILPVVAMEDIYIVTNRNYMDLVRTQLPEIPEENIILEPVGRNTAPCIGLGAMYISKKYDDALMIVLPSDHLVKDMDMFLDVLSEGCAAAEAGENLVTIGITPTYPETGYGYIKYMPDKKLGRAFSVEKFVEKPDKKTAEKYLASGDYLWNSGMFIWKVSTILERMETLIPGTYKGLISIRAVIGTPQERLTLKEVFPSLTSESVDYAIMERSDNIYIIPGDFGWDDVGSWLAVERINTPDANGNTVKGQVVLCDTENTIIQGSKDKLIAMIGLSDFIIVDTDDALLLCPRDRAGEIKQLLEKIRDQKMDDYL